MFRRPSPAQPAPAQQAPGAQATTAAPVLPELKLAPYRPLTRQRRWLIVLLTLATVALIAVEMLKPHMQLMNAKAARAEAAVLAACPPGAASVAAGCPGGRMQLLVLPAGPAPDGR